MDEWMDVWMDNVSPSPFPHTIFSHISSRLLPSPLLSSHLFSSSLFFSQNDRMNVPTDQTRWFMTPQTINAYYHPSLNEIVFPAAILQVPLLIMITLNLKRIYNISNYY